MESRQGSRYYQRVSRDTDIYISGYVREMEKCNFKLCRRNNKSGNGKVNCNGGSLARGRVAQYETVIMLIAPAQTWNHSSPCRAGTGRTKDQGKEGNQGW